MVEATGGETGRALWDRTPVGPYSLPEARGRVPGDGRADPLTALTRDQRFTHLWLEIRPDNTASQRAGYVFAHRVPGHCDGHDCLIWTCQAASA